MYQTKIDDMNAQAFILRESEPIKALPLATEALNLSISPEVVFSTSNNMIKVQLMLQVCWGIPMRTIKLIMSNF